MDKKSGSELMTTRDQSTLRLAAIAMLAARSPGPMGRTAIMKLTYFLQTLKAVPLAYSFRLYTYGPYDPQVLEDLKIAEAQGAIDCRKFEWQGGLGYEIKAGEQAKAKELTDRAEPLLSKHSSSLDWVLKEFGTRSASDLELASTIIYVDRAGLRGEAPWSQSELVTAVNAIKPHHTKSKIDTEVTNLKQAGFLVSVTGDKPRKLAAAR
jgi:uncharacterized protein YwgA